MKPVIFFALTKTLEGAPLGIGYAIMRGGAMIFVWLISTSFMGEQITPRGLVSIVLILLGITLANPKRGDKGFLKHGFTSAIVAAFFIAGKKVLDFKSNFSGSKKYLLLSAGIFSASSFILFLYGLVNSGPGVAISLRNTSVAFAQLFAFFLGEKLAMIQWFAFLCVLAGTAFLV